MVLNNFQTKYCMLTEPRFMFRIFFYDKKKVPPEIAPVRPLHFRSTFWHSFPIQVLAIFCAEVYFPHIFALQLTTVQGATGPHRTPSYFHIVRNLKMASIIIATAAAIRGSNNRIHRSLIGNKPWVSWTHVNSDIRTLICKYICACCTISEPAFNTFYIIQCIDMFYHFRLVQKLQFENLISILVTLLGYESRFCQQCKVALSSCIPCAICFNKFVTL